MALMFTCTLNIVKAQDISTKSDKELSDQYKAEMNILKSEIKTLKLKLKTDKDNVVLKSEIKQKTEDFNLVKEKKTVIDRAIKSRKASEKATAKAEKARQEAEKAEKAAKQIKEGEY
jgi:type IV secretory pathway VirB10-like protein